MQSVCSIVIGKMVSNELNDANIPVKMINVNMSKLLIYMRQES